LPPPRLWPHLLWLAARAVAELVRARLAFARITMPDILAANARAAALAAAPAHAVLPAWIAYTMPRVARRVPFRSDCLVQALAAQRWLARAGYASIIVIGAERPPDGNFAAHAWLACGTAIITGGDVARYTRLV
jgi:hypothetical protein